VSSAFHTFVLTARAAEQRLYIVCKCAVGLSDNQINFSCL